MNYTALIYYQKAIEINPKYIAPYYNIANIYLEKGDYASAKHCYSKIIELDPNGLYGKEALNKLNSLQNMGY